MRPILLALISVVLGTVVDEPSKRNGRQRINLFEFYPPGISFIQVHRKYQLSYGVPTPELSRRIAALAMPSVAAKLQRLRGLLASQRFARNYPTADFLTPFVEMRLLSLLIRIAVNQRNPDELSIHSACDIILFLEHKYPQIHFDYLTPQHVLDAYYLLGQPYLTLSGDPEIVFGDLNNSEPCPVRISSTAWTRYILQPRINRLLLTGYEDIVSL